VESNEAAMGEGLVSGGFRSVTGRRFTLASPFFRRISGNIFVVFRIYGEN